MTNLTKRDLDEMAAKCEGRIDGYKHERETAMWWADYFNTPAAIATIREAVGLLAWDLSDRESRSRGSTHWAGCAVSHPNCAAIAKIRAFLARFNDTPNGD